jgi:hypothetical protein
VNTIQFSGQHATSGEAIRDIKFVSGQSGAVADMVDVAPSVAVAIASWYQSPGAIGSVLAAFASGTEVNRTELLDDISRTVSSDYSGEWPVELELLSTFVINHGRDDR